MPPECWPAARAARIPPPAANSQEAHKRQQAEQEARDWDRLQREMAEETAVVEREKAKAKAQEVQDQVSASSDARGWRIPALLAFGLGPTCELASAGRRVTPGHWPG